MFVAMFICQLLPFCLFGMQISGHGFCYFHAWPGRRVRNDIDWFMFVLVISGLLNQPEPGALRRLFLVHVLLLLVQQAGLDTWLVRQGCSVIAQCGIWLHFVTFW